MVMGYGDAMGAHIGEREPLKGMGKQVYDRLRIGVGVRFASW